MKIAKTIESCWDCDHINRTEYCSILERVIDPIFDELFDPDCPLEDYVQTKPEGLGDILRKLGKF
jgi:hypothetical protein